MNDQKFPAKEFSAGKVCERLLADRPCLLDLTYSRAQELLDVPEIAQAVALAEESAYTPGELEVYEGYWDQVRREKTLMMDKFVEGKAEGKKEGTVEKSIEVAKKLIALGITIEIAKESTGLSREEIEAIRASIGH